MKMTVFFRKGNLELRSEGPEGSKSLSIVQWFEREGEYPEFCIVLAKWEQDVEGYNLHFIGSRPFHEEVNQEVFWAMAKAGDGFLNALCHVP